MAFRTYTEGLKIASDIAQKAVLTESSVTALPPLSSPLPILQKAFPIYIQAAESYSHLISSTLVPASEKPNVKRKWKLVLERAEKVKRRIEELGGQVGKASVSDEGEEDAIIRRGGKVNGIDTEIWREPRGSDFELGKEGRFKSDNQPDLPNGQLELGAKWQDTRATTWDSVNENERWVVTQGVGADCSVVAGLGVCLERDRRWKSKLGSRALHPKDDVNKPKTSENGKHVVKLMLNGAWRSVIVDALLPYSHSNRPLYADARPFSKPFPTHSTWVPILLKGYFLVNGGYSIRGSNPAPDIYALTGWIPERLSLREGLQREKEWKRLHESWNKGDVLATLGSGKQSHNRLVPYHAYAVLNVREEGERRLLEVYDPGVPTSSANELEQEMGSLDLHGQGDSDGKKPGLALMEWDTVCSQFDALNLNWNPALTQVNVARHWSWSKPGASAADHRQPRYRLQYSDAKIGGEILILLSQHIVSKDRRLDDVALIVIEEHTQSLAHPGRDGMTPPYSNSQHTLYRYQIRKSSSSLLVFPSRDRGVSRTDFTLQALTTAGTLSLDRISETLSFSQAIQGQLTSRTSGGHSEYPDFGINPQYKIVIGSHYAGEVESSKDRSEVRIELIGDGELPWNVKLLWSGGERVFDVAPEAVLADSGAYSYGVAYATASGLSDGVYTVAVSSFEPGSLGSFSLSIESSSPISIEPLAPEGAGLFHRHLEDKWTEATAAGRPGNGQYNLNPHIDLIVPKVVTIQARLHHPAIGTNLPLNLTLFKRGENGKHGDQVATSGPYSDNVSGVRVGKTKLSHGVYTLIPSGYEKGQGRGKRWRVDIWGDGQFEIELQQT